MAAHHWHRCGEWQSAGSLLLGVATIGFIMPNAMAVGMM